MAERNTWGLYRTSDAAAFEDAVRKACRAVGAAHFADQLDEDAINNGARDWLQTFHGPASMAITMPYSGLDYTLRWWVGHFLACPWIELRIQEGSHWDYSLYDAQGGGVHNYSTSPRYFDEDLDEVKGRPNVLAGTWGIDVGSIDRFLAFWPELPDDHDFSGPLGEKAYDHCEHTRNDIWECLDFAQALGVPLHPATRTHRVVMPILGRDVARLQDAGVLDYMCRPVQPKRRGFFRGRD